MNEIKINAPAKVNLFLDIVGRRYDGYHILKTMMHTISLYDVLTLKKADKISLSCDKRNLPKGKGNLAFDAAELFCRETNTPGVSIYLKKVIPSGAGLGGGSSDAAAVLRGLNQLYQTNIPLEKLSEMALKLGADVPFFLTGGCGYVTGIGEVITKMPTLSGYYFVIVQPKFRIRTPDAYKAYDRRKNCRNLCVDDLLEFYKSGDMRKFYKNLDNVLTDAVSSSEIDDLVRYFKNEGALSSCMTGSGSAVFGIFEEEKTAQSIALELKKTYRNTFFCEPVCIE